jgi:hypothetical protein
METGIRQILIVAQEGTLGSSVGSAAPNPTDGRPTSRKKKIEQGQSPTITDRTTQQGGKREAVDTHIKI